MSQRSRAYYSLLRLSSASLTELSEAPVDHHLLQSCRTRTGLTALSRLPPRLPPDILVPLLVLLRNHHSVSPVVKLPVIWISLTCLLPGFGVKPDLSLSTFTNQDLNY